MEIKLTEFQSINPEAHAKALVIISECGMVDDPADTPTPEEFRVFTSDTEHHMLQWSDYGPFNPVPEWVWDPSTKEWVDGESEYERFLVLREK